MAFTLYSLIQAAILCVNAVAVLHEERFLCKSKLLLNLNITSDIRWDCTRLANAKRY